jgi:hypothetical protein
MTLRNPLCLQGFSAIVSTHQSSTTLNLIAVQPSQNTRRGADDDTVMITGTPEHPAANQTF